MDGYVMIGREGRTEHVRRARTRLFLPEICARLEPALDGLRFVLEGTGARAEDDRVTARLKLAPYDPRRVLDLNLTASLTITLPEARLAEWERRVDALDEPPVFEQIDRYYLRSRLSLDAFCARLSGLFGLAPFDADAEDANEWAIAEDDRAIVHVSHAYRLDTYHEWDPARCPPKQNYSVDVKLKSGALDGAAWRARWIELLAGLGKDGVYSDGSWHRP